VYLRILASFLSFLIPIGAIGVYSYLHAAGASRRDYIARIGTNLETSSGMIEQALKMAQSNCFGFFSDSAVGLVFGGGAAGESAALAERWRIPPILQRNEIAIGAYADRIFAFADGDDLWVSGGMNDFAFFFQSLYRYAEYDGETFRKRLERGKPVEALAPVMVSGPGTAASRVVPIVMRGNVADRSLVLVLNISADALERTLRGGAILEATRFLVFDGAGRNILHEAPELGSWIPSEEQLVGGIDSRATIGNRRYFVSCRSVGESGWRYVAVTPSSALVSAQRAITRMTIVISAVLVAMSVAFAFFFSSVIYNPIRALRDVVLAGRGDPDARAGDEFIAIRQGLDQLREYGARTKDLADHWTREYVENAFRFILRGHRLGGDAVLREALEREYRFSGTRYACAAVIFEFEESWYRSVLDSERLAVSAAAKEALLALVGEKIRIVALELRQDRTAVIGDISDEAAPALFVHAFRQALRSFSYDEAVLSVTIGVGRCRERLDDLSLAWDEAMTAAAKGGDATRMRIVEYDGAVVVSGAIYTPLDEQELLNALKEGDCRRLETAVVAVFNANEGRGVDRGGFRSLRDDLVATGRRFLAESGVPPNDPAARIDGAAADEAWGASEYRKDALDRLLRCARTGIPVSGETRKGGLAQTIARYVESHYDRGLCLERIADELGVSAKYVSKVFKEATGENLTDRIDRVRIAKAKELLLASDISISEVSVRIGIDSRATFLRVFRRVEGSTPSEYRTRFGTASRAT